MNQHWYYCHTCQMVERIGVCSICARVCHKGHDISYAKYGSFFCDCGAKEDGSCKALVKRQPAHKPDDKHAKAGSAGAMKQHHGTKKAHIKDLRKSSSSKRDETNTRRKPNSASASSNATSASAAVSTIEQIKKLQAQARLNKNKQLQAQSAQLVQAAQEIHLGSLARRLIDQMLLPVAKRNYASNLLSTASLLARRELATLRGQPLPLPDAAANDEETGEEVKDELAEVSLPAIEQQALFNVTLGSQEGAFEHVRMTYAGEDGAQIKQLIQSQQLRRSSMCCIASGVGGKQHLVVTHERGKSSHFTILQLNALLKQDSNKRNKLTLTKLNTISVPFTLVGCVANPTNANYLALTGLKDCMVMFLNENGQTKLEADNAAAANSQAQPAVVNPAAPAANGTNAQAANATAATEAAKAKPTNMSPNSGLIVLQPALEGSNHIVKAIWLPGSKSELAIVTADFVKIYDLSVDKLAPMYYFLLPMGKIRDATFVNSSVREESGANKDEDSSLKDFPSYKQQKFIVMMSSCGFLYYEALSEATSARNGVYYITNTIDVNTDNVVSDAAASSSSAASKQTAQCDQQAPGTPTPAKSAVASPSTSSGNKFGGGVSVYYSFRLQMLFWSYQQGRTFVGSFKPNALVLDHFFPLTPGVNKTTAGAAATTTTTTTTTSSTSSQQALCHWSEITAHPGLVMSMTLASNNPVILMLLSDRVYYQEIKLTNNQGGPTKAKIQDMVAIRHLSTDESSQVDIQNTNGKLIFLSKQKQKKKKNGYYRLELMRHIFTKILELWALRARRPR
jgi:E3 ubiquitin-protein ligase UBR4